MRVLVSGTGSGLGRALLQRFGGEAYDRTQRRAPLHPSYDWIIHCATDARKDVPSEELGAYCDAHLGLTERLLALPHELFVMVSSQAVYPCDGQAYSESDRWVVDAGIPLYGALKLACEQRVRARSPRSLILRCSSLLGREARLNNVMKVILGSPEPLFLAPESRYNLIGFSQVEAFLREAAEQRWEGIFNLGSTTWTTLGEIAAALGHRPHFGAFTYLPPVASLAKVQAHSRAFDRTALEVARLVAAGET